MPVLFADDPTLVRTGIALGLALLLWLVAMLLARLAAPRVRAALGGDLPLMRSLRPLLRNGIAAGLFLVGLAFWPWSGLPRLALAVPLGIVAAALAAHIMREVAIQRWVAVPVVLFIFVSIISGSAGGLLPVAQMLDSVGFDLGKRHLTFLSVLSIAATCLALFAAVRIANRLVARSIGKTGSLDATQKLLAQKLSAIAVIVIAFFVGVDLLSIDLTAFAVFSGALGLAVGFGLQKTFGNLIAGIILLMDRSIKPGDVIVVGQSFGWVNKIGVRAVSVITRDGKEHLIPNENLMTQEVENWSYSDRNVRIRIPVGIAYDSDLKLAQQLMLDAALESPRVLRSPRPNVWLTGFGEYRVEHDILVWISDPEGGVGNVKSDVLNRLWEKFRDQGIVIPYPQRDVHVRERQPN